MARRKINIYLALLASLLATACTTSPSVRYDLKAESLGTSRSTVASGQFDLAVYQNTSPDGNWLHIYLEGDGAPFFRRTHISTDPTSKEAVALKMMASDPHKSYLIGRPCYHQNDKTRHCKDAKWWTSHRYSSNVVASLRNAVLNVSGSHDKVRLIGFSGGGSLAALIAADLKKTVELITVNANIDIDAWTKHHNYTPLAGSLNPIAILTNREKKEKRAHLKQTHFIGELDQNVNWQTWHPTLAKLAGSTVVEMPNFTHLCCWAEHWPMILETYLPNKDHQKK